MCVQLQESTGPGPTPGAVAAAAGADEPKPKKKRTAKVDDPPPTAEEAKLMPQCPKFPIVWANIGKLMSFYSISEGDASAILIQVAGPPPKSTDKEKEDKVPEPKPKAKADNKKKVKEAIVDFVADVVEPKPKAARKSALRKPEMSREELMMDSQPAPPEHVPQQEEEEDDDGEFHPPHPDDVCQETDEDEEDLDGEELDDVQSSTSSGPPGPPPPPMASKAGSVSQPPIIEEMDTLPMGEPVIEHIEALEPVETKVQPDLKEVVKKVASPMKVRCENPYEVCKIFLSNNIHVPTIWACMRHCRRRNPPGVHQRNLSRCCVSHGN